MDVGIKDGKIAAAAGTLNVRSDAAKTIDSTGYYVTPGLIDIHTHDYASTGGSQVLRGRLGDLARRLHPPLRGHHEVRCRQSLGWRNFGGFQRARYRPRADLGVGVY